jgi:hypothetical protein
VTTTELPRPMTLDEMEEACDAEDRASRSTPPPAVDRGCSCTSHYRDVRWTGWELCPARPAELVHDHYGYAIDLTDITTSAEMLDWIFQIRGKDWPGSPAEVTGLLTAFWHLLDPQRFLCSFGTSKRISKRTITRRIADVIAAWPLEPET